MRIFSVTVAGSSGIYKCYKIHHGSEDVYFLLFGCTFDRRENGQKGQRNAHCRHA